MLYSSRLQILTFRARIKPVDKNFKVSNTLAYFQERKKCLTVKKTLAYLELPPKSFATLGSGNLLFLRQINPINPTKKTFFSFLGHSLALNGDKDKLFEKKISSMLTKQPEKKKKKTELI